MLPEETESQINPFSIRILALDSALRFTFFSVEEAEDSLKKLTSSNFKIQEEGRWQAIRLFRSFQLKIMDYEKIRGSFDSPKEEKLLTNELKLLSKEVSIFLVKIRDRWNLNEAINFLRRIISLDKYVKKILKRLKKRTPSQKRYFYAGIDGGSTSTKTVISDENGKIIGKAESGPSWPAKIGVVRTFESLVVGLKRATEKAGLNFETTYFRRICAGMCGINTLADHRRMNELMYKYIRRFHNNIGDAIIIQDSLLAWYGAFRGEPGIVVIGGTGHMVYGNNNGREVKLVGKDVRRHWTETSLLGGREISLHASKKIQEKLSKKSETILVRYCRSAFKKKKLFPKHSHFPFIEVIKLVEKSMLKRISPLTDQELSAMAKLVLKSAKEGDEDSISIIKEAVDNAAFIISSAALKIGFHNKPFKVAYVGSVVRHPFALMHLKESLPKFEPYARLVRPKLKPEIAGIQIARRNIHFY